MRSTANAIKQFLGGFKIPAYAVNTVPDDVALPYLTYPLVEPEWNQKASFYVQGYYKTTDYTEMLEKADQIVREIGQGITIGSKTGYVVLYPETPLIQILVDGDVRSFYINLSLNAYQMPGAYPEPTPAPSSGQEQTQTPSESPEEGD